MGGLWKVIDTMGYGFCSLSSFLVGNEAHILVVVVVEVGIYSPFFHGHNGVYSRWKAWERKRLHVCLVLDFLVWFCSFETSF